ncbi:hypothetical protein ACFLXY_02790 [Chloroflexota bacterium]
MSPQTKKILTAITRKVVSSGVVLLVIWLVLMVLRSNIPEDAIEMLNESIRGQNDLPKISLDSSSWDWDTSLWTGESVSERTESLGNTLKFLAVNGVLSLGIAALLLYLGILITKVTTHSTWLSRLRSILRLVLVSSGASVPIFAVSVIVSLCVLTRWDQGSGSPPPSMEFLSVFLPAVIPVWLMVQAGHGEIVSLPENRPVLKLFRNIIIKMIISLFRMTGLILVISIVLRVILEPVLGSVLKDSLLMRDFPVIFAVTWIFAIIIVMAKLAADLIEIEYERLLDRDESEGEIEAAKPRLSPVPGGWLLFCLILTGISVLIALFGPLLAPYVYNEIILNDRMAGPSAEHLLGADNLGRDILSRLIYGLRLDIFAGLTCAGILAVLASGWAILAIKMKIMNNRLGNILEELVLFPGNILSALPWLLLLILPVVMIMPMPDYNVMFVTFTVCLILLPRSTAMIRSLYLFSPEKGNFLRNLSRILPIVIFFIVPGCIIYISTATYWGLGFHPPLPELGNMLTGTGRQYFIQAPWMSVLPCICLALLLALWVMTGNALLEKFGFRTKVVWAKAIE